MAITTAITDLIKSFLELLESVLGSVYTIAHSFVAGIAHLFAGFFAMVGEVFGGVFDMVGGVGRFLAGNVVILGVIAAAGYMYVNYTRAGQVQSQQARQAVANGKKRA